LALSIWTVSTKKEIEENLGIRPGMENKKTKKIEDVS